MEDRGFSSRSRSGSSGGGGGRGAGAGARKRPRRMGGGFRKKRPPANLKFDYKNVYGLAQFITEEGKITPGRVSGLSAQQQRQLTTAVKRARNLAFLSAVGRNTIH